MSAEKAFQFHGFTDLELSTQLLLRDALIRGLSIDILDRGENIIRLGNDKNIQYIKQATRTSIDTYSSVLMMENKVVTKKILAENNFLTIRCVVAQGDLTAHQLKQLVGAVSASKYLVIFLDVSLLEGFAQCVGRSFG